MSWLGVNLNDSLNSLKGQITNFTKEVLSEDDVPDSARAPAASGTRVAEVQSLVELQKQQIEELRNARSELEERVQAAYLQCSVKNSELLQRLTECQDELKTYKQQAEVWGWDGESTSSTLTVSSQSQVNDLALFESRLQEEKDRHQAEVTALLDKHEREVTTLKTQLVKASATGTDERTGDGSDDNEVGDREGSGRKDLEAELCNLKKECGALKNERDSLSASLEELDAQHQAALKQLVKKSNEIKQDLDCSKKLYSECSSRSKFLEDENETLNAQLKKSQNEFAGMKESYSASLSVVELAVKKLQEENCRLLSKSESLEAEKLSCHESYLLVKQEYESVLRMLQEKSIELKHLLGEIVAKECSSDCKEGDDHVEHSAFLKENVEIEFSVLKHGISSLKKRIVEVEETSAKNAALLEEKHAEIEVLQEKMLHHEAASVETSEDMQRMLEKLRNTESKTAELNQENEQLKCQLNLCVSDGEVVQQLIVTCCVESAGDLVPYIMEITKEVAELRCERDRLHDDIGSVMQEIRDTQDLVAVLEGEKIEAERECEELRDQLSEFSCGERMQPEGSATRSLPTIEEEDGESEQLVCEEVSETHQSENINNSCGNCDARKLRQNSTASRGQGRHLAFVIEGEERGGSRHSQQGVEIQAGSELSRHLEIESSSLRKENELLAVSLNDAENRLSNLVDLEAEAVRLHSQNESLLNKISVLELQRGSCMLQNIEKESEDAREVKTQAVQVDEGECPDFFVQDRKAVEFLRKELTNLQQQSAEDICALKEEHGAELRKKDDELVMYKEEIQQLNHLANKELFSSDMEKHQAELDQIKAKLIYKEDQLDEYQQGLRQIADLFGCTNSDLRSVYVTIKSNCHQEKKKLIEKEKELNDISVEHNETLMELQSCKEKLSRKEEERMQFIASKNKEAEVAQANLMKANSEMKLLTEQLANLTIKAQSQAKVDKVLKHVDQLQEENTRLKGDLQAAEASCKRLAELCQREEALTMDLEVLRKDLFSWKERHDQAAEVIKEKDSVWVKCDAELKESVRKLGCVNEDNDSLRSEVERLGKVIKEMSSHVSALESEREQLIAASHQKHQESLTYYAEIQRLAQSVVQEKEKYSEEKSDLSKQLSRSDELLSKAQEQVKSLSLQVESLRTQSHQSTDAEQQLREQIMSLERIMAEETERNKELYQSIISEKEAMQQEIDQLRLANSTFNTQYEEQTRQIAALKEKEASLSLESGRLRQHLLQMEETYTQEAVQAEQREATLRATIDRLDEKLSRNSNIFNSANQRANIQVESLQAMLSEALQQKDMAVQQLHAAEENAEQNRDALNRLQQVLQDFQKSQSREVAQATDREKRLRELQEEKNKELMEAMKQLQEKLHMAEHSRALASQFEEKLQGKENTIVALRNQVSSYQHIAKRSQEQLSVLQLSTDARVDKTLLRNLFIGYFATPPDKQKEVLRVIAQVLDFSLEERARTGLDGQPTSWLTSFANFLAPPPPSNVRVTSKVDILDHTSLSQAFVRFLEDESSPVSHPKLPAIQMAKEAHEKAQRKAQVKSGPSNASGINVHLVNSSVSDAESRRSPLLTGIDTYQLPSLQLVEQPTGQAGQPSFTISPVSLPVQSLHVTLMPTYVPPTAEFPSEETSTNKILSNLIKDKMVTDINDNNNND